MRDSFALDALDLTIAPVPGGLASREAHQMFSLQRSTDLPIGPVDVVELNPRS